MLQALLKACSFILILALGFGLKKAGLFGPKDYTVMTRVVLNVTLPAAVIVSFANNPLDLKLLILVGIGFGINCILLTLGHLIGRKKGPQLRPLWALALPGYNIGAFALPFTQSFLGAEGVAATCLFDTGNAIMCTGGSYAVTDALLNRDSKLSLKALLKKLSGSTPFMIYLLMLVLTLTKIQIPKWIADLVTPMANANPYCAMMMVGLMFEINFPRQTLKNVIGIVILRNVAAIALSLFFYFLAPLPPVAAQTLAVLVFAPPSAVTAIFTEKCGGEAAAASCATSLCTITAILGMITVLTVYPLFA